MTDIIHFADAHGGGDRKQVLKKLEEHRPDFITLENAAFYPLIAEGAYQPFYGRLKESALGLEICDDNGRIFDGTSIPTKQALLEYAFGKFPIFYIDAYRRVVLEAEWPLPPDTANKIVGILPPNGRVVFHDFGLPSNVPIIEEKPFVASSNLAMAKNINALVNEYCPRRIAHLSGIGHYISKYGNRLQDLCNTSSFMIWNTLLNQPLDVEKN